MYMGACYEDVAIIIDGWADTCEQMMQQGEYDHIEHTYIHACIRAMLFCSSYRVLVANQVRVLLQQPPHGGHIPTTCSRQKLLYEHETKQWRKISDISSTYHTYICTYTGENQIRKDNNSITVYKYLDKCIHTNRTDIYKYIYIQMYVHSNTYVHPCIHT